MDRRRPRCGCLSHEDETLRDGGRPCARIERRAARGERHAGPTETLRWGTGSCGQWGRGALPRSTPARRTTQHATAPRPRAMPEEAAGVCYRRRWGAGSAAMAALHRHLGRGDIRGACGLRKPYGGKASRRVNVTNQPAVSAAVNDGLLLTQVSLTRQTGVREEASAWATGYAAHAWQSPEHDSRSSGLRWARLVSVPARFGTALRAKDFYTAPHSRTPSWANLAVSDPGIQGSCPQVFSGLGTPGKAEQRVQYRAPLRPAQRFSPHRGRSVLKTLTAHPPATPTTARGSAPASANAGAPPPLARGAPAGAQPPATAGASAGARQPAGSPVAR